MPNYLYWVTSKSAEADVYANSISAEIKLSDGEAPVLELREMWSTPLLSLLPGSPSLGVVVSVKVPSMGQIEIFNHFLNLQPFNCVQTNDY